MPIPTPPALFLIDGYALIYRAFFAMIARPLRTSKGENTSAAWGVVNFLMRLREKYRPDYVAWVNDAGTSFREERYPEYKSTREKLDDELQADFDRAVERIRALLDAFRIPLVTVPGYEADDVIGTLATRAAERGLQSVIVSGDKDFYQLIGPGIALLNPGRGGAGGGRGDLGGRVERLRAARRAAPPGGGLPLAGGRHLRQRPRREGASARRARRSCSPSTATSTRCSRAPARSPPSGRGKRCSRRPTTRGSRASW